MLKINKLTVSYKDKKILKGIDCEINQGEVFGVLGRNGAGKTTLFNALYKQIVSQGEITLSGKKLEVASIAYLEVENYFYPYMKASEYLSFFTKETPTTYLYKLAEIFEIPLDAYIDTFSTGMKKKIALIGVTALQKPVLILDEPFNGLDMESVEKVYLFLKKIKEQGTTILMSSHIIETLTQTCDRIGYLEEGVFKNIYNRESFQTIENDIRSKIKKDWELTMQ